MNSDSTRPNRPPADSLPGPGVMDRVAHFDQAPFLAIWEVTRACALVCHHCRAAAEDRRDPRELSTEEGRSLIAAIADMGTRVVIFTGGDPLQRDDLELLIRHAKGLGLRVGTIPAETPRLTGDRIQSIAEAGVDQIALSLDGSRPEIHDGLRGVPGCFDLAMRAVAWAHDLGLPVQINTVVCARTYDDLPEIARLVRDLGAVFWEVFLLVPTGRGAQLEGLTAHQVEEMFAFLYAQSMSAPFLIKITEAPHYRRYIRQHPTPASTSPRPHGSRVGLSPWPVNAGKGFCFIDHVGEVYPSGFLPISAGNVRTTPLATIYRNSELFRSLRDPNRLRGRCGRCEFRNECGGSRSRAYALTGDVFAEDPWCAYDPPSQGPSCEADAVSGGTSGLDDSRKR